MISCDVQNLCAVMAEWFYIYIASNVTRPAIHGIPKRIKMCYIEIKDSEYDQQLS